MNPTKTCNTTKVNNTKMKKKKKKEDKEKKPIMKKKKSAAKSKKMKKQIKVPKEYLSPAEAAEAKEFLSGLKPILTKGLSDRQKALIKPQPLSKPELNKLLYCVRKLSEQERAAMQHTIDDLEAPTKATTIQDKLNDWNKNWSHDSAMAQRLREQQSRAPPGSAVAAKNQETLDLLKQLRARLESGSFKQEPYFSKLTLDEQMKVLKNIPAPRWLWKPDLPGNLPLQCRAAVLFQFLSTSGGVLDKVLMSLFPLLLKYFGFGITFAGLSSLSYEELSRLLRGCSKQYQNAYFLSGAAKQFATKHNNLLPKSMESLICVKGFSTKMASLAVEAVYGIRLCPPCDMHLRESGHYLGWGPWCQADEFVHHLMVWMKEEDYVLSNEVVGGLSQLLQSTKEVIAILFAEAKRVGTKCVAALKKLQLAIDMRQQRAESNRKKRKERKREQEIAGQWFQARKAKNGKLTTAKPIPKYRDR